MLVLWTLPFAVVGWVVILGLLIIFVAAQSPHFTVPEDGTQVALLAISAGLLGAGVALPQRYVLHHWLHAAPKWLGPTALGWSLAGVAWWGEYMFLGGIHFTIDERDIPVAYFIMALAGGLATGLGQWLAVRSARWITITVLGWTSGIMVGFTCRVILSQILQSVFPGVETHNQAFDLVALLGFLTLSGIIAGAATGVGLFLLIQNGSLPQQKRW